MKLLIVDDEELTRSGVVSSIDWTAMGIDQVLQADDGIRGLETALRCHPEIILCDVRMPRMDGITMLNQLEQSLPDTIPIFMSGYSDKEYLKAAIRLKAVRYIEKPLDPQEIREAVLEARKQYIQKLHSRRGETLQSLETGSRLALYLTTPWQSGDDQIEQLADQLSLRLTASTWFTALVVRLDAAGELALLSQGDIYMAFEQYLRRWRQNCLYVEKRSQYLVYFIFGPDRPSPQTIEAAGQMLGRQYAAFGSYFIAAGPPCQGVSRAYQSYTAAVILLQSSFFFPKNTVLVFDKADQNRTKQQPLSASPESAFLEALIARNQPECQKLLEQLYRRFSRNMTFLQNQAKEQYYRLLLCIEDARRQLKITGTTGEDSIVGLMEQCFSYDDLHHILSEWTGRFFEDAASTVAEHPTIYMIKTYIARNYANETLSVKDISSHVFLSASYVCTFFKNETGQTLNQYLTEYRMERAKQLLGDPRYKISEISSRVGYSDGNYFGKSFKKYSGLSPSEYRERVLQ